MAEVMLHFNITERMQGQEAMKGSKGFDFMFLWRPQAMTILLRLINL